MEKIKVTNEEIDGFLKKTEVFSVSLMQDFVTFLMVLKEKGIRLETAVNMIAAMGMRDRKIAAVRREEINEARDEWESIALKCDKCGKPMSLAVVNTVPGNQVGGKFKAQWFCPDIMGCGHYILSRKSLPEIVKKRRRKANYKP